MLLVVEKVVVRGLHTPTINVIKQRSIFKIRWPENIKSFVVRLCGSAALRLCGSARSIYHFNRTGEFVAMQINETLAAVLLIRPQLAVDAARSARLVVLLGTEVAHQSRLAVAGALRLRHATPDIVLSLIVKVTLAVVARLLVSGREVGTFAN